MTDDAGHVSASAASPGASHSRLVATAWAGEPRDLLERVRVASDALDALGPAGAAHLVEVRFDLLARPASQGLVQDVVRAAGSRLLATCRAGGPGSPAGRDRLRLLAHAVGLGARGCDVELGEERPELPSGALLVVSHHSDAELTPEAAAGLAARLAANSPSIAKLVAPARSAARAHSWACAAAAALPPGIDLAAVATGAAGAWMRHLAPARLLSASRPLSALAYVRAGDPLPGGDLGQPLLADALGAWDIPGVGDRTRLFAIIGWPLTRTWSPRLHGALFRRRGIDARLVALPIEDRAECALLAALRLEGVAVTMPHKPLAAALAGRASERVGRLGSANSLRWRAGQWEAEDFDGPAAAAALGRAMPLRGADVVIVGAGGAARAAALALAAEGAVVTILARRPEAAQEAARACGVREHGAIDPARIRSADVLVQATPAGGVDAVAKAGPVALPRRAVLDMVTTPADTPLIVQARQAGLAAVDGLTMLALQAAAQQAWWSQDREDLPPRSEAESESVLRDIADSEARA